MKIFIYCGVVFFFFKFIIFGIKNVYNCVFEFILGYWGGVNVNVCVSFNFEEEFCEGKKWNCSLNWRCGWGIVEGVVNEGMVRILDFIGLCKEMYIVCCLRVFELIGIL